MSKNIFDKDLELRQGLIKQCMLNVYIEFK